MVLPSLNRAFSYHLKPCPQVNSLLTNPHGWPSPSRLLQLCQIDNQNWPLQIFLEKSTSVAHVSSFLHPVIFTDNNFLLPPGGLIQMSHGYLVPLVPRHLSLTDKRKDSFISAENKHVFVASWKQGCFGSTLKSPSSFWEANYYLFPGSLWFSVPFISLPWKFLLILGSFMRTRTSTTLSFLDTILI